MVGSEFSELRKKRDNYAKSIQVQVETQVPDIPLDALSLRSIIQNESWVATADKEIAVRLGGSLGKTAPEGVTNYILGALELLGIKTVQEVRNTLSVNAKPLGAFTDQYRSLRSGATPPDGFPLGISLFYMVLMLMASRGESELSEALRKLNAHMPSLALSDVVAIAKRSMS